MLITGKQVKNGSLTVADIRNNSLDSAVSRTAGLLANLRVRHRAEPDGAGLASVVGGMQANANASVAIEKPG